MPPNLKRRDLAAIVDSALDCIVTIDAQGKVVDFNRAAEETFGYRRADAIGRDMAELIVPPHLRAAHRAGFERYLATRQGRALDRRLELTALRADGVEFPVELTIICVCGDARPLFTGFLRDVTDRKRREAELSEVNRRKDRFLAMLAHELRNPLAPLRNALELMRLAGGDAETLEQARAVMERQVAQIVRLVDDLLNISRISLGKFDLRTEPVELAPIVERAVETIRPAIERMGHQLIVRLPPRPVVVLADAARLEQVFANLLNNAAKYNHRGGHVWLTVDECGGNVVVSIKDDGIGIGAEDLPHLFEMFTQVDHALEKAQGGLGIGLTLAKQLVDLHGGGIEARSDGPDKGAEFIVRLPLAAGNT